MCSFFSTVLVTFANSCLSSGRYCLHADSRDGSFFVDRDGSKFHHVLNFLRRDGTFDCPHDVAELTSLREEAVFYKISELENLLTVKINRLTYEH